MKDKYFFESLVYVDEEKETIDYATKDRTGKVIEGEYRQVHPCEATLFTIYEKQDDESIKAFIDISVGDKNPEDVERLARNIIDVLNMETSLGKEILRMNGYLLDHCPTLDWLKQRAKYMDVDHLLDDSNYREIGATLEDTVHKGECNAETIDFAIERYVDENHPERQFNVDYEIIYQGTATFHTRTFQEAVDKMHDDFKVNKEIYIDEVREPIINPPKSKNKKSK